MKAMGEETTFEDFVKSAQNSGKKPLFSKQTRLGFCPQTIQLWMHGSLLILLVLFHIKSPKTY